MTVSVIMPAYNAEKTIEQSICSVLDQTYNDFELIIINDCSTDNTKQIIEKYRKIDKRIILIENDMNCGVSVSRNKGVQKAGGKYIAFLDSDDMWREDKLKKQVALMEKYDAVLSYTASAFISHDGKQYNYIMPAEKCTSLDTLLKRNLISCSSAMIKASVMKKVKMPGDTMHEDYYVWIKVLRKYKYAYGINEPLLIYRLSQHSKSSSRIRSAIMIYNTYKAVGYGLFLRMFFTFRYSVYSITKRFLIKHGN